MSTASPRVSIILLNWNQFDVTAACLRTLANLSGPTYEVLVVDQASRNEEGRRLRDAFPWIRLIESPTNVGFTGGNNLAMNEAEGDLILLLNNDTEVPSDFLQPLVEHFDACPRAGIASPKIRFFNSPAIIQYAGSNGLSEWTMRGGLTGYGERDTGQYDEPCEVALAHGAAMMIRREVLEDIGLLAQDFFIYYEEFDFCARALRSGWTIHYVPNSLVMHKESMTVGKASPMKTEFMTRNRINYLRRNLKGVKRMTALVYVLAVAVPVNVLRYAVKREWIHVQALWRGVSWHARPRDVHATERLSEQEGLPPESESKKSEISHDSIYSGLEAALPIHNASSASRRRVA